jgi:putative ABC transport system permease protein
MEALAGIRDAIRSADPEAVLLNPASFDSIVRTSLAEPRLLLIVLLGFGGAALFLAVIGIAGIVAQLVRERRHELGIRLALGARPRQIVLWSLGRGIVVGGLGLLFGTIGAVALAPLLARFLIEVGPHDPLIFAGVLCVLGACICVASWIPSRRAARVDPAETLRA